MRLLIVCLGNICRSPMAEGALRARLRAARGLDDRVVVDSCGTGDWHVGEPPDPRAIRNAASHGVDIAGLRARSLCDADFDAFDVLLCADASTLRIVESRRPPGSPAQAALLLDWAGTGGGDVPDPYTGAAAGFESVWWQVDAAAAAIVARMEGGASRDRA
ncbi:low molecular weight phosphotyrosine protein phosphatase [Luteimonas sp. BDR2-5]|uniref:low molecular weight protein-tyrosine-phosphatase n=1 Tax=Proluteimonas luteida TaxID=2878685 RepID=UPI001E614E98|nr:low molecular weight protein-tyrosine-phosphatase [Luteimonas sp. BDR2-5]MCD9027738.1 low molecular weight phosphotyrosine protein phosphatase [Luteimonas sp. BDR2-5]